MSEQSILLVEDNVDDQAMIARSLKKNYPLNMVTVANDGVEALDYLFATGTYSSRDAGQRPGLILLDLKMPALNGLEVLKRLRADERTRRVPVVVLTASDEQQALFESYDLGGNSYIRKPIDANQFSELIGQIGAYWLVLNEPPP